MPNPSTEGDVAELVRFCEGEKGIGLRDFRLRMEDVGMAGQFLLVSGL